MFTGREYASKFAVYEYRARAYHPGLGRFMSEDPKGFDAGDYNLFRYCENDPVDNTDPMGLDIVVGFEGYGTVSLQNGPTRNTEGNVALRNYVNSQGGKVFDRTQSGQKKAVKYVQQQKQAHPREKVTVMGYSRGASAANQTSGKLGDKGIAVDRQITIDAVRARGGEGRLFGAPEHLTVPATVRSADNFYQRSGGPFQGGNLANPSRSFRDHDISGKGVDHNSIVDRAIGRLKSEVQSNPASETSAPAVEERAAPSAGGYLVLPMRAPTSQLPTPTQ